MTEKMVQIQYLALRRAIRLQEEFGFQNTYCGEYRYREHGIVMDSITFGGRADSEYVKMRSSGEIEEELDAGSQTDCLCDYAGFWLVRHYLFHFFHTDKSRKPANVVNVTLAKKNSTSEWKIASESVVNA